MTGVIDYGVGNLFSLMSSLKAVGEQAELSSDPSVLRACDRIILPGVGAFRAAMDKLKEKRLDAFVKDYAATGKSVMGICLGMQLLFDKSYEFGVTDGLGLIRGEVLPLEDALKEKGVEIDKKKIVINDVIKSVGTYDVVVKPYAEVSAKIKVTVEAL